MSRYPFWVRAGGYALQYSLDPEFRSRVNTAVGVGSLGIAATNAMFVTPRKRTSPFNYPPGKQSKPDPFVEDPDIFLPAAEEEAESIPPPQVMTAYIEKKHGGAVSGSSYAGGFGRASSRSDALKTKFLKSGCGIREYIAGNVTTSGANLTAWIGHASYRPALIMNIVCQAIIRKLWYKALARDITSIGSLILSNTNVVDIWVEYFDMDANITRRADVGILATDTLAVAANRLTTFFWSRIAAHEQDIFRYIYCCSADGTQAGPALSLASLRVDILCDSYLKIQNVSASSDVAVDDRESALNVRHVPLQGVMYSGKGNWCQQKSTLQNNAHGGVNESPMEADGNTGVMVPNFNTGATAGGVQTANVTGGWFLPQPYKQLMNCTGSAGIKLSPGSIKSDMMHYSVSQKFNTFIGGLVAVPESVTNTSSSWVRQHTNRGMFKLFGLTRMLHTETTPVNLWYELWYDVYAKVNFTHEEVFNLPSPAETVLGFSEGTSGFV